MTGPVDDGRRKGPMLCPDDMGHLDPLGLRETESDAPQMFVDDYLVENRFDEDMLSANVPHVTHASQRSPGPLLRPDRPWEGEGGLACPGKGPAINADARRGIVRARVTDLRRQTISWFDYDECVAFQGDSVRQHVVWKGATLAGLQGQVIRLEFNFRNADLFAFVAGDQPGA